MSYDVLSINFNSQAQKINWVSLGSNAFSEYGKKGGDRIICPSTAECIHLRDESVPESILFFREEDKYIPSLQIPFSLLMRRLEELDFPHPSSEINAEEDAHEEFLQQINALMKDDHGINVLDLKLWDEKPDPLIERIKKDEGWLLTINEQLEASEKLGRYYLNTGDKEPVKHFLGSLMEEGMEDNFFYCLYQKVKVLFDFLRTYPRDVPEKYAELLYVYYFLASLGKKYIYSAELLKFLPEMENFFNHNFGDIYGIYSRRAESIPVYWEAFEDDEEVEE